MEYYQKESAEAGSFFYYDTYRLKKEKAHLQRCAKRIEIQINKRTVQVLARRIRRHMVDEVPAHKKVSVGSKDTDERQ